MSHEKKYMKVQQIWNKPTHLLEDSILRWLGEIESIVARGLSCINTIYDIFPSSVLKVVDASLSIEIDWKSNENEF